MLSIKRVFDVIVALSGLVVFAPLMAIVSVLIKLDSSGPVFFQQRRVGRFGSPFYIIKFRSMTHDPDSSRGTFDVGDASRVTTVGRLIRKIKVDELPQLFNVLKGDMSLVGPRPEVRKWVDAYPHRWATVLQARPGITDPASIEFLNEELVLAAYEDPEAAYRDIILPKKLALYEFYIANQSFSGDLVIMLKTFLKIMRV